MARIVALALALLLVVLPGCGGGGGGADPVANPPPGPGPFTVGVAYLADADVDEQVELYVADLDGDGFLQVSGQLVAGGDVMSFQWSPDRSRLAFLADKDTDDIVELYTVAAAGGTVAKVSGPLVAGGDVSEFRWSPSSERLTYLADQEQDDLVELFTVYAYGGSSVQVSGAFQSGEGISFYAWAPDSSRIAYVAEQEQAGVPELFTTLAAGGGNVKVSGPMVAGGSVKLSALSSSLTILRPIAWAPDASRIAYLANQDALDRYELFTSLAAGGGNARVNGPMAPLDLLNPSVYEFTWHPDSSRIAYAANELDNRQGEVFVAAPDGANRAQVFDVISVGGFANSLAWSPDGQSIAGCASSFGSWVGGGLFVTSFSGPAVVYSPNGGITFAWSPDSTRIALTGTTRADEATDIYNILGAPAVSSPLR
jgi:Tol biopolymer transport system component